MILVDAVKPERRITPAESPESELERLRDRVAELEMLLAITSSIPPRLFTGLKIEAGPKRFLAILMKREFVPDNIGFDLMYGDLPESEQPDYVKIVHVYASRIRTLLRPHGITIHRVWGQEFFLTPEDKQRINELYPTLGAE